MLQANANDHKSSGIEIEIVSETLADRFVMLPNDLHRGHGHWAGLTLRARALLAALLSMRTGFVMRRAAIDALAPELGTKGVDTVLRELRDRGHLRTERLRDSAGRIRWRWTISIRRQDTGQQQADEISTEKLSTGSRTIPPAGGDGADQGKQGVSAGRTIPPSATDGSGGSLRRPSLEEDQKTPPTPPRAAQPSTAACPKTDGGEENGENDKKRTDRERETAEAYIAHLRSRLPELDRLLPAATDASVVEALVSATTSGVTYHQISEAIAGRTLDGATQPARALIARIRALRPLSVPGRPDLDTRACPLHPGETDALWCRCCRGEVNAGDDPYAGREHLRPAGWHQAYGRRPT